MLFIHSLAIQPGKHLEASVLISTSFLSHGSLMASPRWPSPNNHPAWASPRHTLHPESALYLPVCLRLARASRLSAHARVSLSLFLFPVLLPPLRFIIFVNSLRSLSHPQWPLECISFQCVCAPVFALQGHSAWHQECYLLKKNLIKQCASLLPRSSLSPPLSRGLTHLFVLLVLWDVCLFPCLLSSLSCPSFPLS